MASARRIVVRDRSGPTLCLPMVSARLPGRNGTSMSTLTATMDLPPSAASIPVARRLVRQLLDAWGARQDHGDAALLLTELVANVVDHVGGSACLTIEATFSEDWLRIAVVDSSPNRPSLQPLDTGRSRGRGMLMVQTVADRWGCEDHRDGKRVWFELRPPRA